MYRVFVDNEISFAIWLLFPFPCRALPYQGTIHLQTAYICTFLAHMFPGTFKLLVHTVLE